MNAIVPVGVSALVPNDMDQAIRLAQAMASAKLVPKHLQGDAGSCLMVVEQAMRWGMSPFAVAQCTSSIGGKLMFEGKLIAAAVESCGAIEGGFDYAFAGDGDDRSVTVSARRRGETNPRQMTVKLRDVRTTNEWWKKQPDQMLVYSGTRNWARRWTPAAILGVYAPEEFDRKTGEVADFTGPTIEADIEQPAATRREANVSVNTESDRERVNREVPMDAPKTPRLGSDLPTKLKKIGYKDWIRSIEIALRNAGDDAEQINKVLDSADCQEAPLILKGEALEWFERIRDEAQKRAAPFPPLEDELPEVEIVGAEKVMAG